ncbi:arginine N-methyltransferase 2 protein [Fusarium austroafricanum]|uniref:Arginine N-methyltransferase 2 protein n=1 Tax=Fusarium austroafricanum TaxID=2364996 RepID=A0A8H4JFB3_9HYPO|nr:arginine N-methyltransferase 2 protein [Fusarium austroafricanum]
MNCALTKILTSLSRLEDTSLRQLREKISNRGELVTTASAFENRANEAVKLISAWTKHQTTIRLRDIVEGFHKVWMIDRLNELLDCIPNNLMDPDLRISLHNIIGKVARYKVAARYLYRMAKRFPALRRAEVVSVTLQRQMFAKVEVNHYSPSLPTTLHRIANKCNLSVNPNTIYSLLKLNKEQAERLFSDHVRRALRGAKIHAEIQLFYHIEELRLVQPPRVVCSSKDACYLCDYFITITTKLHSPKCHGRLYPGWRLPALSAQDQTLRRFNHALEEESGNSIRNLLRNKKKVTLPDPRESTIFTIGRSISTLASASTSPNTAVAATDGSNIFPGRMASQDENQSTTTIPNECSQAAGDIPEHSVPGDDKTSTLEISAPKTADDQIQILPSSDKQGDPHPKLEIKRSKPIAGCVASDDMSCIRIGPLRLYVEYSASHNSSIEYLRKNLKFDVEWIDDINDGPARQNTESSIIDVEKSGYIASLPLNSLN